MRRLAQLILLIALPFSTLAQDFRDIVINEIYADNNPAAAGFPNLEFVELYNTTDDPIELSGYKINDKAINSYLLAAKSYVAVGKSSIIADFSSAGIPVIDAASFPTLTNSSLHLWLTDPNDDLMDSLTYDLSWYRDGGKDDGGYSLEQINPYLSCSDQNNWSATASVEGGTPGLPNSILDPTPDISSPEVVKFVALNANTIEIEANEPMDTNSAITASWLLDHGGSISGVETMNAYTVKLIVDQDLDPGLTYTLSWSGWRDCAGNETSVSTTTFSFDTSPPQFQSITFRSATILDIKFDEPLSIPEALSKSNYLIDNAIGQPVLASLVAENEVRLTLGSSLTEEQGYTLTISNISDRQGNAIAAPLVIPFIYLNQVGTVTLISATHLAIAFDTQLETSTATNTDNYVVDGQMPVSAFIDPSNALAVHLIFQEEFVENKNLTLTIKYLRSAAGQALSTPDQSFIYDTKPPKFENLEILTSTKLKLFFDEPLSNKLASTTEHYEYDDIYPYHAQLMADQASVVIDFEKAFPTEQESRLYVGGLEDMYGNRMKSRTSKTFRYDPYPPRLDSLHISSPSSLKLYFHESLDVAMASNLPNYEINGLNPVTLELTGPLNKSLEIHYENELPQLDNQTLRISGLSDLYDNMLTTPIEANFDNASLSVSAIQVDDPSTLTLHLNRSYLTLLTDNPASYKVNGKSVITANILSSSIKFSLAESLSPGVHRLAVTNIAGTVLSRSEFTFEVNPKLSGARITNAYTVEVLFEIEIGSAFPSQFTLEGIGSPKTVGISQENRRLLRLSFDQPMLENQAYQLKWTTLQDAYRGVVMGCQSSLIWDTESPIVDRISVINASTLQIFVSEALTESSATHGNNFEVGGHGYASHAKYKVSENLIELSFVQGFVPNQHMLLTIRNLIDMNGNIQSPQQFGFEYKPPVRPSYNDILISEIMASPIEGQHEFIELYNATDQPFDLSGITLRDGTSDAYFTSGNIEPKQSLVFFPDDERLSRWLSLNNSGENLTLLVDEKPLFSISYSDDWHITSEYSEKGHSLEMVDVENPCGLANNWTSSKLPGGTPGHANSQKAQNPDNTPPNFRQAIATGRTSIELVFDEKILPKEFSSSIHIDPNLIIDQVELDQTDYDKIVITFFQDIDPKQKYSIKIDNLTDCVSNLLSSPDNATELIIPVEADSLDVVINEILFNPRSGGVDFVELFNHSDKDIDLYNWTLTDATGDRFIITNEHLALRSKELLALSESNKILAADYPTGDQSKYFEMKGFPSYNDDQDTVFLFDSKGKNIDAVPYDEDYHYSLLKSIEGVSLERISPDLPSNEADTWESASSLVGFATPGLPNSQSISSLSGNGKLEVTPKVFFPDQTGNDDFTTISYHTSLKGNTASITIYSAKGQVIRRLVQNKLLAPSGVITWDGIADNGQLAPIGYYIIHFNAYSPDGHSESIKKTVVLGTRL